MPMNDFIDWYGVSRNSESNQANEQKMEKLHKNDYFYLFAK